MYIHAYRFAWGCTDRRTDGQTDRQNDTKQTWSQNVRLGGGKEWFSKKIGGRARVTDGSKYCRGGGVKRDEYVQKSTNLREQQQCANSAAEAAVLTMTTDEGQWTCNTVLAPCAATPVMFLFRQTALLASRRRPMRWHCKTTCMAYLVEMGNFRFFQRFRNPITFTRAPALSA